MTRASHRHSTSLLLLAAASLGSWGCSEDAGATFFDPNRLDPTQDGGGQGADGGLIDGGLRIGDDVRGGTVTPDPADDFVSQWATIQDPDQICAGWEHSCGLRQDGTATCWGLGSSGQTNPPQDESFVRIACADRGACAITEDGRLSCWGANNFGQTDAPTDGQFTEVACGETHCCAIDVVDRIVCWGAGGPDSDPLPPNFGQATPPPGVYRGITAGKAHSCAIDLATDEVVCWGGGGGGECFPPRDVTCGQANPPPGAFRQVAGGFTHSCGITTAGDVVCWGQGMATANCDPNSGGVDYECGQAAPMDGVFERLSAGDFHTCAIDEDFQLRCQGWARAGADRAPPGLFSQVSAGGEHSCAIRRNGSAVCWGNGPSGETDASGFP